MEPIPFVAAFFGGLLAFFSPCVLPLVPAYISYISGISVEDLKQERDNKWKMRRSLLSNAIFFSAGFSFVFILLGASATIVGQFLLAHLQILSKIAGIVIIVLGLHIAGLFKIKYLYYEKRLQLKKRCSGIGWSFLAGIAFAFGWTPCVGPILAGILVYAATKETLEQGILLLSLFSLGMAIPFIVTALLIDLFRKVPITTAILRKFEIVSGIFLIMIGILIFTNEFQAIVSTLTSGLSNTMEWIERFEQKILQF
ncbi:MAG: cytochrome c biogenesis protein CcdA [Pseudomonadota bacterium]